MLWSRSPEAQARTNLRQALATLRKSLQPGPDVVRADGGVLGIRRESAILDINGLSDPEMPAQAGDLPLPAGEFLEGVAINEPGFAEWLTGERAR